MQVCLAPLKSCHAMILVEASRFVIALRETGMKLATLCLSVALGFVTTGTSAEPAYLRCKNLALPANTPNYIILAVDLGAGAASMTWHFTASHGLPAGSRTFSFHIQQSDAQTITAISSPEADMSFSLNRLSGQVLLDQRGPHPLQSSLACAPHKAVL